MGKKILQETEKREGTLQETELRKGEKTYYRLSLQGLQFRKSWIR
jgi:hypothetical protein